MLPLRAIGEAAGLSVVWDSNSKTVIMTNIAEVNNVSTDSKEDIKKYLDGYSQIVKYMASFDELASNMYMITSDNAEGKLPELISELTIVRSDLEKAKNVAAELVAVETAQSVVGPEPDEPHRVLHDAVDVIGRQAVVHRIVAQVVVDGGVRRFGTARQE